MPLSKRSQVVNISKVRKKPTRARKSLLVENVMKALNGFANAYVFEIENLVNQQMTKIRGETRDKCRFFVGKNRLMKRAIGSTREEESAQDLHKLSKYLKGGRGLVFSDLDASAMQKYFNSVSCPAFAHSGFIANETIVINKGVLEGVAGNLEAQLRDRGLPSELDDGNVVVREDYMVCKPGDKLDADRAKLLKLLGYKLAKFQLVLVAGWDPERKFTLLKEDE